MRIRIRDNLTTIGINMDAIRSWQYDAQAMHLRIYNGDHDDAPHSISIAGTPAYDVYQLLCSYYTDITRRET